MPTKFRRLANGYWVAPQITADDVKEAAAMGVALIINNRPDNEEPGQPSGAEIEKAARGAGLAYLTIPVSGGNFSATQLDALQEALDTTGGPVLAYCRSGTRSTVLRALLRARAGEAIDGILAEAKTAGYDLSGARGRLEAFAPERR